MKQALPFFILSAALLVLPEPGSGASTAEELARKFVRGLQNGSSFEEMNEIFLHEKDFDTFVRMLKSIRGLSPDDLMRLEDREEVEKARQVFLRDRGEYRKIWEGGIKKSEKGKSAPEYAGVSVKSASRDGLPIYEIEISFTVSGEGKKEQGSAKLTAFMLDGEMKIAELGLLKI